MDIYRTSANKCFKLTVWSITPAFALSFNPQGVTNVVCPHYHSYYLDKAFLNVIFVPGWFFNVRAILRWLFSTLVAINSGRL